MVRKVQLIHTLGCGRDAYDAMQRYAEGANLYNIGCRDTGEDVYLGTGNTSLTIQYILCLPCVVG
jgi:hypothetical protein